MLNAPLGCDFIYKLHGKYVIPLLNMMQISYTFSSTMLSNKCIQVNTYICTQNCNFRYKSKYS